MAGKTIASKTGQVRYSVPGATGPIGPLVYPAGEYDAETQYIRTALSAPMVLDDGQYYVLNKEGAFTGIRPKDDYAANGSKATWVLMEYVRYAFVEVLMANFAKLASAVFYENVMMSQQGVDENGQASSDYQRYNQFKINPSGGEAIRAFTPNLLLDFLTGAGHLARKNIEFGADGTVTLKGVKSKNNAFHIDENGDVTIVGKVSTSAAGARIEIDPATKSISMYNENNERVFWVYMSQRTTGGGTSYYPLLRMDYYYDGNPGETITISSTSVIMDLEISGDKYEMVLDPMLGLTFYKNGQQTKNYPST